MMLSSTVHLFPRLLSRTHAPGHGMCRGVPWNRMYYSSMYDPQRPAQHYQNLELVPGPSLTQKRIKQQYQKLAMQWHPDRNGGSDEAKERFTRISESYKLLSSPAEKRAYDNWILSASASDQRGQRSSSSVAWAQSRAAGRTSSSASYSEQYRDRRAEAYEDLLRGRKSSSGSSDGSDKKNNFHYTNSQYQSAIHSMNAASSGRRQDRMENDQVNARKEYMRQDKIKFSITVLILMIVVLTHSRRTTSAESVQNR